MVVVGFAAGIEPGPVKPLDTLLEVIDFSLDVREPGGLLLGGEESG